MNDKLLVDGEIVSGEVIDASEDEVVMLVSLGTAGN